MGIRSVRSAIQQRVKREREIERDLMLRTAVLTALAMHRTGVKVVKFSTIIRSQRQVKSERIRASGRFEVGEVGEVEMTEGGEDSQHR